jgi:hypothetical protein
VSEFDDFRIAINSYSETLVALVSTSDQRERQRIGKRAGEELYHVLNAYSRLLAVKLGKAYGVDIEF